MSLTHIPAASAAPQDFNVVIEIPAHADPVKFEVDKATGALFVDRFMLTAMHYPCNYGFIPNTLSDDGDPIDVLVITPFPLISGVVVRCRPLGVLLMEDESGQDEKILAVPINKVLPIYKKWKNYTDVAPENIQQIEHFFKHYKDLETGKWVKISRWEDRTAAEKIITLAIEKGQS